MEFAAAKINLTLHVTGLRDDGYHLLDSLVVFADVGDFVSVANAEEPSFTLTGNEAQGLVAEPNNLVLRSARLFDDRPVALKLEKNLPTSSGIGGGSADAAATLRALSKMWNCPLPSKAEVLSLGADVPVCLSSKTTRMSGVGEVLTTVPALPDLHLVLANPRRAVSTPAVFKELKKKQNSEMSAVPEALGFADFCTWLGAQRNDLQTPAITLIPEISTVLSALNNTGARLTRMSGSGATCFGIYKSQSAAKSAAENLSRTYPDWWVKPARVL